jgi:hypothetical protein
MVCSVKHETVDKSRKLRKFQTMPILVINFTQKFISASTPSFTPPINGLSDLLAFFCSIQIFLTMRIAVANNGSDDNVNIDSGDYDGDTPSAILKSLFNERLLGSIEVTCRARREIVLNLSDSLALSIALQPIPTTRPTADLTSVERRSRRSPDGLPLPSRRTTTKTAGDSLHFILSQGLSKAQQSLLDHWRSHKAAAIASKILTTIAPPATTVFTSGSATTAVTATARGPPSKLDDNLPE